MADQSDVETALCNEIAAALFGSTSPATAIPTVGAPVTVYRGWPGSVKLDAVLLLPTPAAMVSVFTRNESERTTSRYPMTWRDAGGAAPTLTAAVTGRVVTFAGDCSTLPLNVALASAGRIYAYAAVSGDTPAVIAARFAAAIPGASASGAALTCPDTVSRVTVGGLGKAVMELRRQVKQFSVTIWAASPLTRDNIAKVIDPALAANIRLPMPDGTAAHVRYAWSRSDDGLQRANCFRRDFAYNIEYATTNTQSFYDVIASSIGIENSNVTKMSPSFIVVPDTDITPPVLPYMSLDLSRGLSIGLII